MLLCVSIAVTVHAGEGREEAALARRGPDAANLCPRYTFIALHIYVVLLIFLAIVKEAYEEAEEEGSMGEAGANDEGEAQGDGKGKGKGKRTLRATEMVAAPFVAEDSVQRALQNLGY